MASIGKKTAKEEKKNELSFHLEAANVAVVTEEAQDEAPQLTFGPSC